MRVFNKKLNRLLAIMLASVMGATSLPATQVSADTPSSTAADGRVYTGG